MISSARRILSDLSLRIIVNTLSGLSSVAAGPDQLFQ
jgi:hypothetical protein